MNVEATTSNTSNTSNTSKGKSTSTEVVPKQNQNNMVTDKTKIFTPSQISISEESIDFSEKFSNYSPIHDYTFVKYLNPEDPKKKFNILVKPKKFLELSQYGIPTKIEGSKFDFNKFL